MDRGMGERAAGRMIQGWMNRWRNGWMDRWMDGWMDREIDGWMVRGMMDGWIEEL